MKYIIITIFIFIFDFLNPVLAGVIATQTFVVSASNTITIVISGNLFSTMNADTGALDVPLSINFNITSNEDLENIRLRALVLDSTSTKYSGFYCTNTGQASSVSTYLVMANTTTAPTLASINNCESSSSTPVSNPNTVAYSGTVSIDNSGKINFVSTNGYFNSKVKKGTSNLNLTLTTPAKTGTFDTTSGLDEAGDYKVEIYLDNIP